MLGRATMVKRRKVIHRFKVCRKFYFEILNIDALNKNKTSYHIFFVFNLANP